MAQYSAIRRQRVFSAAEAVDSLLRRHGWKERVEEERAVLSWPLIVGEVNAAHTTARRVDGKTLIVETDSPVWTHTLSLMKPLLLLKLREALPDTKVSDLRFFCGEERVVAHTESLRKRTARYRKARPQ